MRRVNLTGHVRELQQSAVLECMQPSAVRAEMSLLRWQESQVVGRLDATGVASAEEPPRTLGFNASVPLPTRAGRYLLALLNCNAESVSVSGRVSFVDAGGEQLSVPQRSLLATRLLMLGVTAGATLLYAALAFAHRAVTVPMQWMLVLVFALHALHQALLLPPLVALSNGEWLSRGAASTTGAWSLQQTEEGTAPLQPLEVAAEAVKLLATLTFMCALLALSAGRRFLVATLPRREREVFGATLCLYFLFGMLRAACTREVLCGVFVLSFQVVRILLIFAVLLFLNASAERLRHANGHQWAQLRTELPRLLALRKLRWRLLLAYLVLPIVFLFLEVQVLDWRAAWFKVLWREALDFYLVVLVAHLLRPGPSTFVVHVAWLRPAPNMVVSASLYARFFRFLLGSNLDAARADASVASALREGSVLY